MSTPSTLLCIQLIFAGQINKNSLSIPMQIELENEIVETLSLLDSGAGGKFINQNYAKTLDLLLLNLEKLILAINVYGTLNKKGTIKQYVNLNLEIFGQKQIIQLLVTGLGKQKILLRFPWLQKYNPVIDWQTGSSISKEEDPEEWMMWTVNTLGTDYWDALICPSIEIEKQIMDKGAWINLETNSVWICSKTNLATDLAIREN